MAGHSKWSTIKRKKAKADEARGRVFTRLGREIMVAVRHGGPDPDNNLRLKMAVDKAKAANMPNDNIARVIQRSSGAQDGANLEEIVYEGYGPGGVAVMLEVLTDNKNRTVSEIRHILSRHGGNLGESGCVGWMFTQRGSLIVEREALRQVSKSADDFLMDVLDAGAEDINEEEETIEIFTDPDMFSDVQATLSDKGYSFAEAKIARIPQTLVELDHDTASKIINLMNELEDQDDVQELYANFDIPESILAILDS